MVPGILVLVGAAASWSATAVRFGVTASDGTGVSLAGATITMGFADWGKGDQVATASHILVSTKKEALSIKQTIEDGQITFADAATQFSSCPSAPKGGSLGSFRPGEMVKEFDDYCFAGCATTAEDARRATTRKGGTPAWEEHIDDESGLPYYHCRETGESVWERPAATADAESIGVVETEFGVHLIKLEKLALGVGQGKSQVIRQRRMFDTPDPDTGLRS